MVEQKIQQKTVAPQLKTQFKAQFKAQFKDGQKARMILKSLEQPDLPIKGYTPKKFSNIKRAFNRYAYRAFSRRNWPSRWRRCMPRPARGG